MAPVATVSSARGTRPTWCHAGRQKDKKRKAEARGEGAGAGSGMGQDKKRALDGPPISIATLGLSPSFAATLLGWSGCARMPALSAMLLSRSVGVPKVAPLTPQPSHSGLSRCGMVHTTLCYAAT